MHGPENRHLELHGLGIILLLFEQLHDTLTTIKLSLGTGVKIASKLGKCGQFAELCQITLDLSGHLLGGLDLSSRTDTGDGKTDRDGRANTLIEKIGLQINLAVRDGNHVGRNVSRDIACLGLDDRKGGE